MDDDMFKEDDSDISKIGRIDKDFYKIHKETFQFNIDYDSSKGYYYYYFFFPQFNFIISRSTHLHQKHLKLKLRLQTLLI